MRDGTKTKMTRPINKWPLVYRHADGRYVASDISPEGDSCEFHSSEGDDFLRALGWHDKQIKAAEGFVYIAPVLRSVG